jgi:radical SAM/Cys-rich protein
METCHNSGSFAQTLARHDLALTREKTTTLQINVGLACDLTCRHCHLEAGPGRTEMMDADTVEAVIACARRFSFDTIDITGGAPELLPHLPRMVEALAELTPRLIVRTNLTALALPASRDLIELYQQRRVVIIASLPAADAVQTEAQRGPGVWQTSIDMLKRLNRAGYGVSGSGLELDLATNPFGTDLPADHPLAEREFRRNMEHRHGITFTSLFTFANAPLGRFRAWLEQSGTFESYLRHLADRFNPCALPGLMCRTSLTANWQGFLYDCDFNLALDLHHGAQRLHISELSALPSPGSPIPASNHCYACAAGSGFT